MDSQHMVLCWTPAIGELIDLALQEDLGRGDVTTELLAQPGRGIGDIICRQPIVVCGLPLVGWLLERADHALQLEICAEEGERLAAGGVLARLRGESTGILRLERTILNFLMRMCGVATQTRRFVDAVQGTRARIVDTRKTVPGWRVLDKYAVRTGGGANHRHDLGSGILIKDNHIIACGGVSEAVRRARAHCPHTLRVEVEVEDATSAEQALAAGAEVLLLDNLTPVEVRALVEQLGQRVLLEVSGGVSYETVREYAEAGAHVISIGALTHSVPAVDLSLELTREGA